jgi:histidyl-tRNA synthetase
MSKTIQPPPGTRDFYPEQMALRRYIEDAWRRVSLRHGFVEADGPTFEFLDLYRVKSGDEIVSQLFHFESRENEQGQAKEFALRPEFTPTLARMIAAKANALPRPIKWFSIPRCFRAERQQKGRLKEFFQWNVDMLGGETPEARRQFDLEVAALALDGLRELGLANDDVRLLWNDRQLVERLFALAGLPADKLSFGFYLLDRVAKLSPEQRAAQYRDNGIGDSQKAFFEQLATGRDSLTADFWKDLGVDAGAFEQYAGTIAAAQEHIEKTFSLVGLAGVAKYDPSIVRGLAYYTGFVWEISDARGENRAVAGGGRYDKLIEMFGGPALPATGFGMGDVVLAILLQERGRLPSPAAMAAVGGGRPDVFIVNALPSGDEAARLAGQLRTSRWDAAQNCVAEPGLVVGVSYKATKNIGKLLQDASGSGAKVAVIFAPAEWERGVVKVKNLATREEKEVPAGEVLAAVRAALRG